MCSISNLELFEHRLCLKMINKLKQPESLGNARRTIPPIEGTFREGTGLSFMDIGNIRLFNAYKKGKIESRQVLHLVLMFDLVVIVDDRFELHPSIRNKEDLYEKVSPLDYCKSCPVNGNSIEPNDVFNEMKKQYDEFEWANVFEHYMVDKMFQKKAEENIE